MLGISPQEGFLKAWQSIQRFEGRSSFYTWLYSLTVNLTIYSLRRKRRRDEVELNDAIPSSLPCPGANYQRTEIREQAMPPWRNFLQDIALWSC
jgi:RNA polymerase sigma factor (sigma-70 family)